MSYGCVAANAGSQLESRAGGTLVGLLRVYVQCDHVLLDIILLLHLFLLLLLLLERVRSEEEERVQNTLSFE